MLMPVLAEVPSSARASPRTRSASRARAAPTTSPGRPFAFVMTLDGVGPWPPIQESHVEMDGAWALYEAWVKIQPGDVDSRSSTATASRRPGDLPRCCPASSTRTSVAAVARRRVSLAALQARRCSTPARSTRARWPRSRAQPAQRARQPARPAQGRPRASTSSSPRTTRRPAAAHDCPPITDGAAAVVLAAGDVARERCERPAWIRGIDHRIEPHGARRARPHRRPRRRLAAEKAGVGAGGRRRRAARAVQPPGADPARGARARRRRRSTRRAGRCAANPMMAAGLIRIGEAGPRIIDGDGRPGRRPRHRAGPCLQQNLVCVLEGEWAWNESPSSASARRKHRRARGDVSMAGLVREAAERALDDAEMTWADIDAVVIGKAPDIFEGVMMPELYLADALGAAGKPMMRVHTAGSVGGSTRHRRVQPRRRRHPRAGAHRRLREAVREQRHVGAVDADPVPAPAARRRRRLLRPAHPQLHAALEGARPHRHPGGGEGPPERAQEPVRPPARARHHLRPRSRTRRCSGTRSATSRRARRPTAPAPWC